MLPDVDWEAINREMVQYLQAFIQIDTSPGRYGETQAACFLRDILESNGLLATVREPIPGKGSLVYQQTGSSQEQLLLLSHLDVAPAPDSDNWRLPPFGGVFDGVNVWGRGAIDCKGLVIVWLMIVLLLHRLRLPLKKGIVFAATADEESGGLWGTKWLLDHTKDLENCRFALNEGGGFSFHEGPNQFYTCQYAEKGHTLLEYAWTQDEIEIGPRTASVAPIDKNVVTPMFNGLSKGSRWIPRIVSKLPYRSQVFLIQRLRHRLPFDYPTLFHHQIEVEASHRNEFGQLVNHVHLYPLPEQSGDWQKALLKKVGLKPHAATRVKSMLNSTLSPIDTTLYQIIQSSMNTLGAQVVPYMTPGVTDSRYLRERGIVTYGFFPTPPDTDIRLIHKADERISVEALSFALQRLYEIVIRYLVDDEWLVPCPQKGRGE